MHLLKGNLIQFHYLPKRGAQKVKGGVGKKIDLREFAKWRYAYLEDVEAIYKNIDRLWSIDEHDGLYNKSFGIDGVIEHEWSEEYRNEGVFIVCLGLYIRNVLKETSNLKGLSIISMQYHILNMVSKKLNLQNIQGREKIKNLLSFENNGEEFHALVEKPVEKAIDLVKTTWTTTLRYADQNNASPPSAFAFKQDPKYANDLVETFLS